MRYVPRTSYSPLLSFFFFFFNDTATTEIYTLSLHDALPIGLLATGSDTHPPPVRVDVRQVRRHQCLDLLPARQPDRQPRSRLGQARIDQRQADRPAERGGHPAGVDPARDPAAVDDLACLRGQH